MNNQSLYERRHSLIKEEIDREQAYPSPPNYSPAEHYSSNSNQHHFNLQHDNFHRRDQYHSQEPQYHQQQQHYDESRQFQHHHHQFQHQNQHQNHPQQIIHQQSQRSSEDIHSPYTYFSGTPPATPASPVHSYYYPPPPALPSHYEALNHEQYQHLQHHNQEASSSGHNPYQFPLPSDASSSTSPEPLNEPLPEKVKSKPRAKSSQPKPMGFIVKLRELLNGDNNDVLRWETAGKTFIVSHCNPRLTELLLSTFGHSNYTSFTRQLNVYLFNRLDSGTLATLLDLNSEAAKSEGLQINHFHGWKHDNFQRDDEDKSIGMMPRLSPARIRALADKAKNGKKVRKNSKEAKLLALEELEAKNARRNRKGKKIAAIEEEAESEDYDDDEEEI